MKQFIALIFGCCTLYGCVQQPMPTPSDDLTEYHDSSYGYSIAAPHVFDPYGWEGRMSASGKTSDHALWNGEKSGSPASVTADFFHTSAPCSSHITGASETSPLANAGADAEWGRVDYEDKRGWEGFEYPSYYQSIVCKREGTPEPDTVYAFCSEKNSKTVVICINQMTKDEEMAKQIFETFRWVE